METAMESLAAQEAPSQLGTVPQSRRRIYHFSKRVFDIAVSLIGGTIMLLPMVLIGILVKLDSPGPALFTQERVGLGNRSFMIVKFRSMRLDAEAEGPRWADKDDGRCTRLGRVLRRTRLDELPQFWNILKGDMSLVGPRPERECFYQEFEKTIPNFRQRLQAKPGLTGLAQVNGGYDLGPAEKLGYDLEYIKNASPWLDLKCIAKTVMLIFTQEGAR